jgi:hypothetical protein
MKISAWFHLLAAALLVTPVGASPVRPQTLASADAVPEGLSAPEWSSIRQQYEQQRHAAYPVAGGYQARNPGQQWQTRFDGRGFTTKPEGAAWQWGLELQSYGFAGQERAVSDPPRVKTSGPRVTYDWDATLQEWFVNDRRGLEHGFTVRERPPTLECADLSALSWLADWSASEGAFSARLSAKGARLATFDGDQSPAESGDESPHSKGALTFTLAVRGGLRPEVQADGRGVRFVDAQGAAALTYSELTVLDADGRKLPARFESAPSSSGRESAQSISLEGQSRLTSAATGGLIETTAVLRLAIDERGARYPLTIDPIAQQAYLKASNTDMWDEFGYSVAVSGNTVVVGAPNESSSARGVNGNQSDNSAGGSGAAYVFVRNGTNWTQQAYLKASNADGASPPWYVGDQFGYSVAVSGNTVVVGAFHEASSATGVNGDQSDNSVFRAGAAYVFVRNGTTWTQQAYLKASNTEYGDGFGISVSVSGETVVVGADWESAAYIFVRNGTTWTQQAYLKASNTGGWFGYSVAVSGDTVVVGAYGESSNATGVNGNQSDNSAGGSGAAYVFVRSGTTWSQQAYLKASNTEALDAFGISVAVSGDTVVVGADEESSNATGVNGNQSDNSATNSGAAYIFVRNGTNWTQQAYLKASNTGGAIPSYWFGGYRFGLSVAVSGDTVVVGAPGESDDDSGAAYVFVRNGTTWTQQAYLKASNTEYGDGFGFSVSVSGGTVVVGAWWEASNARGVNGNQSDNNAQYSGAAYVFTGVGLSPMLALAPDGSGGYRLGFNGAPEITYRLQRAPSVAGP